MRLSAILWILLGAAVWVAAEPIDSLHATNYVNDFAGVLDAATQARLNALCQQVEQKAQAQIAVVTVKSVDGVLILLATEDRKFGASVGYGLEPILPDGKIGGFRREAVPYLTSGNYAAGLSLMTSAIADVIAKDAGVTLDNQPQLAAPRQRPAPSGGISPIVIILIIIVLISIILILSNSVPARVISGRWPWTRQRWIWILVGIAVGNAV